MKTNYINQLQRDLIGEIGRDEPQEQSILSIEDRAKEYAKSKSSSDVFREGHINDFIAGANEMLPIIKELGEALSRIANRTDEDDIFETDKYIAQTTLDKYKQYL